MASFAKIGLNSKVIAVLSVNNEVLKDADGIEQEELGIDFLNELVGWPFWKQTSYNGNMRKNFASIGYEYDEVRDAFIPQKPYPSWVLNEDSCQWEAPIAHPSNGSAYKWDEDDKEWVWVSD